MSRVFLKEWEAAAFAAGRKSMLLRPVRFVGAECVEEREDGTPWLWSPQHDAWVACPLGAPGDELWGAEAWMDWCPLWSGAWCGHGTREAMAADHEVYYRAGDNPRRDRGEPRRWRSSVTMPRWASRFRWRVADVRVVRVHDVTEAEARALGIVDGGCNSCGESEPCGCPNPEPLPRDALAWEWHRDFDKRHPWVVNPWAWLVSVEAAR